MKHLGDICKINGAEVEPVSVIIGGSPCQDLSVAGKRAGLDGERSGLFMEQIRIIKEMRENDRRNGRTGELCRPRYMVWENVPGAFSSNSGEDFRTVLEETARVADQTTVIPRPPKGRWTNAGAVMGDGWSIAWRVLDAQFWGVPQRRRRISVVCDFGGQSAPEVLFERKGVSGDFEQSRTTREETAGGAGKSTESASGAFNPWDSQSARVYSQDGVWHSLNANENGGQSRDSVLAISFQERAGKPGGGKGILIQNERTGALSTLNNQPVCYSTQACGDRDNPSQSYQEEMAYTVPANPMSDRGQAVVYGISAYDSNSMKSGNPHSGVYKADTSRTLDNNGGNPACNQGGMAVVSMATKQLSQNIYDARENGNGEISPTITGDHQSRVTDYTALCIGNGQADQTGLHEIAGTLNCMHDQQAVMIKEENDATGTQDQVLRILQETYGEKAVVEWGAAILATLQSAKVLQQGMHDSCDERETENGNELDDGSLPRSELVAGWLLRDMREQSERRCSSQGQQSEEQRNQQSSKAVQVVSYQSTQNCKEMFNMWRKGQGLGVLRQALSKIQETRKPSCSKEKRSYYTVRRLTPLEAERLQGYPDGWTDIGEWTDSKGKKHKDADSPRYKALGNSIAVPCWRFILQGISERVQERTMASLFDGIGGFPLIWEEINGSKSCRWVSEIEEFPIAVTKIRFEQE